MRETKNYKHNQKEINIKKFILFDLTFQSFRFTI